MESPVSRVLEKLEGVVPTGERQWKSLCPSHGDRNPSLSVAEGDNGGAVIHCFAGCSQEDVISAMGLEPRDLMPPNGHHVNGKAHGASRNGHGKPKATSTPPRVYAKPRDAIKGIERKLGQRDSFWLYLDATGEVQGVVYRWTMADGSKEIRPVSRHGDGWILGAMPEPRPLLGLPEVLKSDDYVFVTEGEKCADVVRGLGLTATTFAGGSKAPDKSDWKPLAGRDVIYLVDADDPGRQCGEKVAELLWDTGAHEVRIVELPDLPHRGDVADWVAQHSDRSAAELKELLLGFALEQPVWQPPAGDADLPAVVEPVSDDPRQRMLEVYSHLGSLIRDEDVPIEDAIAEAEALVRCASSGQRRLKWHTAADLDSGDFEISFLIDNFLVAGQPVILAGPQKTLKTNISVDLVLSLASGHPFLGDFFINGRANAGLMTGESGEATVQETARRIARSKGWSLSRIDGAFFSFDLPNLSSPSCMLEIRCFIEDHDLKCLVIDPAYLTMQGVADSASNLFAMGEKLKPLGDLSTATGCTIILCHHTRKTRENHFAPPKLEDIAFAGFQEFARQWVMLGRREAYDPEQAGSHKLWLEVGGSAGHTGRWGLDIEEGSRADPEGRIWDVDVRSGHEVIRERAEAAEDEKAAQKEATAERREKAAIKAKAPKAIEFLKTARVLEHGGASESAIRIGAGCSMNAWPTVFEHLKETGTIEPCEYVGGNNRPYPGFRLSAAEQQNRSRTEAEQFGCNHPQAHEQNTPL